MGKPPKVFIEDISIVENNYIDPDGYKYNASKLIEAAKGLPTFDLPLAGVNLWNTPFKCDNLDYFIYQMKRTLTTDLKYPIILDSNGQVADGWHRIAKAIIEGKTTIKAVRLKEMPPWDGQPENK